MLDCNGPGLISATWTVRSANDRGLKRGISDACARLSIWNTPIVSPWQIMLNTSGSSNLSLFNSGDGFIRSHAPNHNRECIHNRQRKQPDRSDRTEHGVGPVRHEYEIPAKKKADNCRPRISQEHFLHQPLRQAKIHNQERN